MQGGEVGSTQELEPGQMVWTHCRVIESWILMSLSDWTWKIWHSLKLASWGGVRMETSKCCFTSK